jgi:hypothetical protein
MTIYVASHQIALVGAHGDYCYLMGQAPTIYNTTKMDHAPVPCEDCVSIHGETPEYWLSNYPLGADYHSDLKAHLCDGCADERREYYVFIHPDSYEF